MRIFILRFFIVISGYNIAHAVLVVVACRAAAALLCLTTGRGVLRHSFLPSEDTHPDRYPAYITIYKYKLLQCDRVDMPAADSNSDSSSLLIENLRFDRLLQLSSPASSEKPPWMFSPSAMQSITWMDNVMAKQNHPATWLRNHHQSSPHQQRSTLRTPDPLPAAITASIARCSLRMDHRNAIQAEWERRRRLARRRVRQWAAGVLLLPPPSATTRQREDSTTPRLQSPLAREIHCSTKKEDFIATRNWHASEANASSSAAPPPPPPMAGRHPAPAPSSSKLPNNGRQQFGWDEICLGLWVQDRQARHRNLSGRCLGLEVVKTDNVRANVWWLISILMYSL